MPILTKTCGQKKGFQGETEQVFCYIQSSFLIVCKVAFVRTKTKLSMVKLTVAHVTSNHILQLTSSTTRKKD